MERAPRDPQTCSPAQTRRRLLGPRMAVAPQLACLLCSQILLSHLPPYAVDVAAQAPAGPTPAAVLSPPVPEGLPPTVPERLPQLPSSQAPAPMAATPSLPVQSAVLPPASLPPASEPGLASLSSAVQLTVELAPEVCGEVGCAPGDTWGLLTVLCCPQMSVSLNALQVEGVAFFYK